jgi:hypothetical protein
MLGVQSVLIDHLTPFPSSGRAKAHGVQENQKI